MPRFSVRVREPHYGSDVEMAVVMGDDAQQVAELVAGSWLRRLIPDGRGGGFLPDSVSVQVWPHDPDADPEQFTVRLTSVAHSLTRRVADGG